MIRTDKAAVLGLKNLRIAEVWEVVRFCVITKGHRFLLSLSWMKSKSGRAIFHLYSMMTRVNVCGDGEAVLKLAALAGHTGCKENGGHGSVRLGTEN